MQCGVIKQPRQLGSVRHRKRLQVQPFGLPALLQVEHQPTIAAAGSPHQSVPWQGAGEPEAGEEA